MIRFRPIHGALVLTLTGAFAANTGCAPDPDRHAPGPFSAFSSEGDLLPQQTGPGLVPSPRSPIPDVPMPVGFAPLPSQSSSSTDGQVRRVQHVYQGRAKAAELVKYYRQNLVRYDWEFVDQTMLVGPKVRQRYVKGSEELTITASRSTSFAASSILTVNVEIGPRAGGGLSAPSPSSPGAGFGPSSGSSSL